MKARDLTDAEIRALGWEAVLDRLGVDGALRFVIQTQRGHGDYSERRHVALGHLSVSQLVTRMRATRRGAAHRRPRR
ncbi:MAG: hypothetical protein ABSA52_22620 [Candidatus Binatia bacterium]|jgi:hypothetical protein